MVLSKTASGRYKKLKLLGEGSGGRVWLVSDSLRQGARLALKELTEPDRARESTLRREFATLTTLRHPNLVDVFEFEAPPEGAPRFTMEYVDGLDFVSAVRGQDPSILFRLIAEALRALAFFHDFGVVHRDVKPANLLVRSRPLHGTSLVVVDFGLAFQDVSATQGRGPAGTLPYIAPELFEGGTPDRRSDLYALGSVAHEAVWGVPPFGPPDQDLTHFLEVLRTGSRSSPALPEGHPPGLRDWIDSLLSVDPGCRPATASEALARLNTACGTQFEIETRTTRIARLASGPPPGRQTETESIWRFLSPKGGPRVLFLTGGAGSGKTRLLRWLAADAIRRGWNVQAGSREILEAAGQVSTAADPEKFLVALRARASRSPMLVLIDNADSAPLVVVELLERVAREYEEAPLRVCIALRPMEVRARKLRRLLGDVGLVPTVEEVKLSPLGQDSIQNVVERVSGPLDHSSPQLSWLTRESEGNPLVLESLLIDEAWEGRETRATHPTLEQSVRHRCELLSPAAQRWLESLVVLGTGSSADVVAALSGLTQEGHQQAAAEAVMLGLAARDGEKWSPASRIVSEVTRSGLIADQHSRLHQEAALLIERRDESVANLACLARLWKEAGDVEKSLTCALRVAEIERGSRRLEQAAEWYRFAALQLARQDPRRRELRARHAELLAESGQHAAAVRAYATVLRLTEDRGKRAAILAQMSRSFTYKGLYQKALDLARLAESTAESCGLSTVSAQAKYAAGLATFRLHRLDDALTIFIRAAQEQAESNDAFAQASSLFMAGICASQLRRFDQARNWLREALSRSRLCANPDLESRILVSEGILERRAWRHAEALEAFRQAKVTIEAHGLRLRKLELLANEGPALLDLGRYDDGLHVSNEAERLALHLGERDWLLTCRLIRGEALVHIGRPVEAAADLRKTLGKFRVGVQAITRDFAKLTLVEALCETPSPDQSEMQNLLEEVLEGRSEERKSLHGAYVLKMERRLLGKNRATAKAVYDELKAIIAEDPASLEPPLRIRAEMARSRATLDEGQAPEAIEIAIAAAKLAEQKNLPALAARAYAVASQGHEKTGNRTEARGTLRKAREQLEAAAARIKDDGMRQSFRDRSVFRAIRKSSVDEDATGEQRLLAIYGMIRALNSQTDPDDLLEAMMDMALDVVRAERGLLLLRDGKDGEYKVRLARNLEKQTIDDAAEFSRNVVLRAGAGKAVLAVDTDKDDRLKDLKSVSLFGIRSVLCVPLRSRGEIVGAVYLDNRKEGALFTPDDLRFLEAFADHAALALENARIRKELERENQRLQIAADERVSFDNIIGRSAPMQQVYELIPRVADSHLPVLIQGESGTGKELVARAIHAHSPRKRKPFLRENCAAIPESLLESELFGHTKGAFTGADRDRAGLFEQAHGGTLFLDEISDMAAPMQARLLRVLQEGELRRVGGERILRVDVRAITATNRDLQAEVEAGRFREDLFYRLQVLVVQLPPLRDRPGDIPLLVDHFLRRISRERGRPIPKIRSSVISLFERYTWPGNIRQLENTIQRLALLAGDGPITPAAVESDRGLRQSLLGDTVGDTPIYSLEHNEREQIRQALTATNGNRTQAAKLLGISRATIFRKIKEFDLS